MSGLREYFVSILPAPVQSALRPWWRRFFRFKLRVRDWWGPFIVWAAWLIFQCARHRRRAVIICRCGGIGDVLCTLAMCDEVRRRHPGKLIVFLTAPVWQKVVVLSGSVDLVYASKRWRYPFTLPTNVTVFGLVDAIYNPLTTSERLSERFGMACHLIEDFAASCGFTVKAAGLPKLHPSGDLIERTCSAHGLDSRTLRQHLVVGINPGPNWPVKEWEPAKWQKLIDTIHSNYDATILQFGINRDDGSSDYANLTGVKSLAGRLRGEELVALIAFCDLIISIDSGPVHIAGAVGTPVIGLFGPLDPALVLPQESAAIGLFANVPCLFCHNRTPVIHWITGCPYDIACMKKLDEETVFGAIESMLAQSKRREPSVVGQNDG